MAFKAQALVTRLIVVKDLTLQAAYDGKEGFRKALREAVTVVKTLSDLQVIETLRASKAVA